MRKHLNPSLVVSFIALFVALGGASYAAIKIPNNSIGSAQIKNNAVTGSKVKNRSLAADDFVAGQLPRGAQGERGSQGERGAQGNDASIQRIVKNRNDTNPPTSPTLTVASETFTARGSGLWDISLSDAYVNITCTAGGTGIPCGVSWGLWVDGVPIPGSGGKSVSEIPGYAYCPGATPPGPGIWVQPSAGATTFLSAGSHTVAVKVQIVGPGTDFAACPDGESSYLFEGPFAGAG